MPRPKAASSAARISAALTTGESNQPSPFFLGISWVSFLLEVSSPLVAFFFRPELCDDFEDFRRLECFDLLDFSRTASARTKSRFGPPVSGLNGWGPSWPAAASEAVRGRWKGGG